jgi:type VI secretion system protein ImpK
VKGAALTRAAGDVFATMVSFQSAPDGERPSVSALRSQLIGLLEAFAQSREAQGAPSEDLDDARFALVAWIDEVILTSGWRNAPEWERDPLQAQLFGTRNAGLEFYKRMERLRKPNAAALEVFFYCLTLGFQGEYVGREGDRAELMRTTLNRLRLDDVGRAIDVAHEKRLMPAAYQVDVQLSAKGSRLFVMLAAGALGLAAVFSVLFAVLWARASGVPVP